MIKKLIINKKRRRGEEKERMQTRSVGAFPPSLVCAMPLQPCEATQSGILPMRNFFAAAILLALSSVCLVHVSRANNIAHSHNLCRNVLKHCKEGDNAAIDDALDIISGFDKICLRKQLLIDHLFCLISPQQRDKHKSYLENTKMLQPKACVLSETDKYYDMEKQTYSQVVAAPRVKCIAKRYVRKNSLPSKPLSKPFKETVKCPISTDNQVNRAIRLIRSNKPKILSRKNLADYLFCLTSPRHAEGQRTRLEESKEEDALPKLCNLALESKSNVYAGLDNELYQDIKSDLRVQCILYRNGHIKVDDASKFNVHVKFDCTKLHSSYDCKRDGYYYGCHWFKRADMYSPKSVCQLDHKYTGQCLCQS